MKEELLEMIRFSLWNTGEPHADRALFEEMQKHRIAALPGGKLAGLHLPPELYAAWRAAVYKQAAHFANYRRAQEALPVRVPYVLLKGMAAAQYYPRPEYRAMGDIDLMPRREDYDAACDMLLADGYAEITEEDERVIGRHRQFKKDKVTVEVHAFFSRQNDPAKARFVDEQILSHIDAGHILPDLVNGLVLVDHIHHHLESGLGLRQVIDWMLFADRCLSDDVWPAFQTLLREAGHETLALHATRMCEMYLGLSEHAWCAQADLRVCEALLDYVIDNGNFGNKKDQEGMESERFLSNARTARDAFRFLQNRGLMHWEAARRHRLLRPFAWAYQLGRYAVKGVRRKDAFAKLKSEYTVSRERNALMEALGVSREGKGLADSRKTDEA